LAGHVLQQVFNNIGDIKSVTRIPSSILKIRHKLTRFVSVGQEERYSFGRKDPAKQQTSKSESMEIVDIYDK